MLDDSKPLLGEDDRVPRGCGGRRALGATARQLKRLRMQGLWNLNLEP